MGGATESGGGCCSRGGASLKEGGATSVGGKVGLLKVEEVTAV